MVRSISMKRIIPEAFAGAGLWVGLQAAGRIGRMLNYNKMEWTAIGNKP